MSIAKPPVARAPRGLDLRPVSIGMSPAEIAVFKAEAVRQNRSMSSLGRVIFVKGLHAAGLPVPDPSVVQD